jgi:uncharacterized protein (UPF0332 family)
VSFDWSDYLKLANELAPRPINAATQEAKLRCAISRAYYANYCKARNHLRDKEGQLIPAHDAHRYVIDTLLNSTERKRKDLGKDLNRLRVDRIKADYYDEFNGVASQTEVALLLAEKVNSSLDNL